MLTTRRELTKLMAAGVLAPAVAEAATPQPQPARSGTGAATYDVAVIGAGAFGAWTAHAFKQLGQRVCLIDAFGAAHSRASSSCETRIIRSSYGDQAIYSRWAMESRPEWQALQARSGVRLFEQTGVLAISTTETPHLRDTVRALTALGLRHELLDPFETVKRFPVFRLHEKEAAIFEPDSGALFARRAVQTLVAELVAGGVDYRIAAVRGPKGSGKVPEVVTQAGDRISAGHYVFACGPWMGKVFPDVIGKRIEPTRAEVFFLGLPAGSTAYDPQVMPTWMDSYGAVGAFGFPNLEARGCKVAVDLPAIEVDPDTQSRLVTQQFVDAMREFVAMRLPSLAGAPIVETRVCQYEMAKDEDYILSRHPEFDNVWIAGGGSGHGFKNGPRVGRYVSQLVTGAVGPDPRFAIKG